MLKLGSGVKKESNLDNKCTIRLLDDNEVLECEFQSYHKGRYLTDFVFNKLQLIESDYFALRYVDQNKQRHWLDPDKNILKQIKNLTPILFCFRVKFYPADPLRLQEEVTRYQLFLQLRRDLLHGRLYCSQADAQQLAAAIVQAELGDYDYKKHCGNYISDFKILLKQTNKIEEKIMEIHETFKGYTPLSAETFFLKKASHLDTYGVDPHPVKDHRGSQLYLGLNHAGVLTFQGSRKTHHFRWSDIQKINYEGKMFIVHLMFCEKKHTVGFKCPTASACRHLWRCAVEQRLFFTLENSNKAGVIVTGGSFFSRGSRFRYAGRCEKEVVEESSTIIRDPPEVKRVPLRAIGRSTSLPTSPADSDIYDAVVSEVHRPLPYIDRSTSLDEEVLCGIDTPTRQHYHRDIPCSAHTPTRHYHNLTDSALNIINAEWTSAGHHGAYCPESTLPPLSLLEPLLEARDENKSRSSSILDSGWESAQLAQHLYGSYRGPHGGHISDLAEGDSSSTSTETLGPASDHITCNNVRKVLQTPNKMEDKAIQEPQAHTIRKNCPPSSLPQELVPMPVSSQLIPISARVKITKITCMKFLRIFFVAFVCIIFILVCSLVLVLETQSDIFQNIRSTREVLLLRIQYYDPFKSYFKNLFGYQE